MTTEKELREILAVYGCGLEVHEFSKNDRVTGYPTRMQGIHKIQLNLRGHLSTVSIGEIAKHLLSKKDFEDWSGKQTPVLQSISKQKVGKA